MCGRFTLTTPAQQLAALFDIAPLPEANAGLFTRYNIAPTQEVVAVRDGGAGERPIMVALRWGLVPSWADDPKIGNRLINARAESVSEKPSFRDAFRSRRCLILTNGFFEWKAEGIAKTPYYIRTTERTPFAFAGLWDRWQGREGTIESCTILTTEANPLLQPMHQRMPVILEPNQYRDWLNPREKQHDRLRTMLQTYPAERMEVQAVGNFVNDVRFDDPLCVAPRDTAVLRTPPVIARTSKRSRSDQLSLWNMDDQE